MSCACLRPSTMRSCSAASPRSRLLARSRPDCSASGSSCADPQFYSHAVGTAAFPGLVLADGLGFSAPLGALGAALVFAFGVERLASRRRSGYDSLTALVLVGALALGVILASDDFHSGANVDTLLFGTLQLVGTHQLAIAAAVSAAVLAQSVDLCRRWLAVGFDSASASALGVGSTRFRTPCCSRSSPWASSRRSRRWVRSSRLRSSSSPRRPCGS